MTYNTITDILAQIDAMRSQEEILPSCRDYFPSRHSTTCLQLGGACPVDEACRIAMRDWCFTVVDGFGRSRETVWIAMSFLDRYLSSGKGKSSIALENRHEFQLASITCFYMAVKLYEPNWMGINMLVKMCRNVYKKSAIEKMEQDILFALNWRMIIFTPMDFFRHFLELMPELKGTDLEQHAQKYMDCSTNEARFSEYKTSSVAVACVIGALVESEDFSSNDCQRILSEISMMLSFDIASSEIVEVQEYLLAHAPFSKPRRPSRAALSPLSKSIICHHGDKAATSPVSVAEMA